MNRTKDILVAVFVSFESLLCAVLWGLYMLVPTVYVYLGTRASQTEAIRYLALVPAGLLALMAKSAGELLFPSNVDFATLQKWPEYHMVKDRYVISLAIVACCAFASLSIWLLGLPLPEKRNCFLFVTAIGVSLVTYTCFLFATWTVKEILTVHAPTGKKDNG